MTVHFRNVEVAPGAPPDRWPFEAVLAAVERGFLSDWRILAAAIRDQPWGPCAQAVETIVSWRENYGVDDLLARVLARARADADAESCRRYGERIRAVRASLGLSQREFAPLIGTSASRLSSYENGTVAPSVALLGRIDRVARRAGGAPDEPA